MSRADTRDCADGYALLLAVTTQIDPALLARLVVIAHHALHRHRHGMGNQPIILVERQRTDIVVVKLMPPRLRAQHQRKAGIPGNVDRMERVHLDRDAKCHK